MFELSSLGFGPFFSQQLRSSACEPEIPARIAAEHRGAFEVWGEAGAGEARLAGRLLHDPAIVELPGVGDWVVLRSWPSAQRVGVIERVLARRTLFTRGAAGRETRAQVVAANVDRVLVICGLDGDFNPRRIERYLARVWASGAEPTVVLNKADLASDVFARIAEVERNAPGVAVVAVSALHAEGLDEIRAALGCGTTVALVGSSGAGKSTLVNALVGGDRMRTGEVRAHDSRGRHVTTHRQLVLLPEGGVLLDTPGMRELQLLDDEGLDAAFEDIASLADDCRFRDCRHRQEPGCAVRAAVDDGRLPAERLESFRKLVREAESNARRQEPWRQRQAERVWGQLSDEVAQLRRWKGGKP